jgi:hypothetical protein
MGGYFTFKTESNARHVEDTFLERYIQKIFAKYQLTGKFDHFHFYYLFFRLLPVNSLLVTTLISLFSYTDINL